MKRQTALGGAISAEGGRAPRPDPFALPARFAATDAAADGRVREVEIDQGRVRLRRQVRGMVMSVNVPVTSFVGVAMRPVLEADGSEGVLAVSLEHRDPALTVQLCTATEDSDIVAAWRAWARVLALPLLIADGSGALRQLYPRVGALEVGLPGPRRRRKNAVNRRRPRFPLRRRMGDTRKAIVVHREREIIARN